MLNGKLIGEELRNIRTKSGKSVEIIGKDNDIHPNTLYKYEKDATDMPLGLLSRLLQYYGIDETIFFRIVSEYNHIKSIQNN